ncbi:hypothetical protein [Agrobacterium tumefaciens]|uniref:hypothetical protein n=1 Tax=Agrobacterium tumefaciens TaxID=358 RepID=UPI00045AC43B|nr:hypothetical protein [Agrobacterium tumefaciens]CDN96512.1 hypothetical protein BN949_05691 [Agrobacterium tumefaciens]
MKRIVVDKLIAAFPLYADLKLLALPDGWLGIVNELFCDFRDLQKMTPGHLPLDQHIKMVAVDWRQYQWPSHVLYVRPLWPVGDWTPDMSHRLIQVVGRFNQSAPQICEVCGQPSIGIFKYQDARMQQALCQTHMDERRASE